MPSADSVVAPTFAVEPVNSTIVVEGSRVVLECAGRGYPQPRESWDMAHARVFPPGASVEVTGELVIEAVAVFHAGTYICRIRDQNHTLIAERRVELIVRGECTMLHGEREGGMVGVVFQHVLTSNPCWIVYQPTNSLRLARIKP